MCAVMATFTPGLCWTGQGSTCAVQSELCTSFLDPETSSVEDTCLLNAVRHVDVVMRSTRGQRRSGKVFRDLRYSFSSW